VGGIGSSWERSQLNSRKSRNPTAEGLLEVSFLGALSTNIIPKNGKLVNPQFDTAIKARMDQVLQQLFFFAKIGYNLQRHTK
jgi:hypothetical protein